MVLTQPNRALRYVRPT